MPLSRNSKLQMLLIKEYYSRKLFVYLLQGKTQNKILQVLTNFLSQVATQYKLCICKISQDNNTATLLQQGSSLYKRQALETRIDIKQVLLYTYKPNRAAKRRGQEIITKLIKIRSSLNLPKKLQPKVVAAAAQLYNISLLHANKLCSPNKQLDQQFT